MYALYCAVGSSLHIVTACSPKSLLLTPLRNIVTSIHTLLAPLRTYSENIYTLLKVSSQCLPHVVALTHLGKL